MDKITVRKYRVFCATENVWFEVWSDVLPTACPNNIAHPVTADNIVEIDRISRDVIKIREENVATGEYIRISTVAVPVPSGAVGEVTPVTIPWENIQTSVLGINFEATADMRGDLINVYMLYDVAIGTLSAPVAVGSKTITMTPAAVKNMAVGFILSVTDGATVHNFGQITVINMITGVVTLTTPTTVALAAGSVTRMSVRPVKDYEVGPASHHEWGSRKIGGMAMRADSTITVFYKNNNGLAKRMVLEIEYLY